MALTYDSLYTTTLTSAQGSITFSSISSAYTDLIVTSMASTANVPQALNMTFNSTGSGYSRQGLYGDGSFPYAYQNTTLSYMLAAASASNLDPSTSWNIQNYANTSTYKTLTITNSGNSGSVGPVTYTWANTSAISTLTITPNNGGSINSGTRITIWGVKAA